MSSTPDDKPQRATAAQLAARRIKDVRRRPRAGTPSSSAGASFGTPFSSLDPNTVSSPPAAQQPMTNGFSFGQSQSFPPASPTPKPPAQNGGSQFAFGSGGGSSAFNFSASFGGTASTPASNPFASMNTGAVSQQPQASSFTGFKGNMFNVPSTGSQSPAQQPLPSGGLFGAGPQQSGPTGGLFGSTANGGFSSQPATTAPTNGSIFGQPTTGGSSSNLFAQSGADKPNPFPQSASFGDDSMQTSPDSKSVPQKSSIFGGGSGGFGASTSFGASGTSNLFGGTAAAPAQTPSKPLFGAKPAEQTAPATPSLFGASTQPTPSTSAASSSSAAPLTTSTTSSSLFSTSAPKTATAGQNPFQPASFFGATTPSTTQKPTEAKAKEEAKPSDSTPSKPSFNFSSTTSGPSLFSQSATAAPTQPNGASQPVSAGSLFASQPAKPASSAESEKPKPDGVNPFNTLFQKPAAPAAESPKTEQKPLTSSSLFAPKPAPSDVAKTNEPFKAATSASPFSASTLAQPSSPTPQSPAFSFSAPKATSSAPAPASAPASASESPFKFNGSQSDVAPPSLLSAPSTSTLNFEQLQPAKLPSGLDKHTKEGVEMAHRVRLLNECFQREVTKLDAKTNDFDHLLQFYLRVRETIGAPVEGAGTKRKAPIDTNGALDVQSPKKVKTFGSGSSNPAAALPSNTASSQPFNGSQNTPASSNKRKAAEDNDGDSSSPSKRTNGDSTTASIFASSFSRSRTSDSDEATGTPSFKKHDASSLRPSTPESPKPSMLSTTPKTSPPKPAFSASTLPKETSTLSASPSQSPSTFKPSFTASATGAPSASPFVIKPSTGVGASTSAAPLAVPKFGSGVSGNFLSQFKAQSDKEAEKEKEKRKAEEFDSDEDDEAEWARQDAEKQRKKREEIEAQQNRRAKFVPGQGFSFEDDTTEEEKSNASVTSSILDSQPNSFSTSTNIFGNLSAVPSENEHDDAADDTEEDSVSGDDDATEESSFAPTKGPETGTTAPKVNGNSQSPAPESSDEGDFTKVLEKSKQSGQTAKDKSSGGRSMFDRVEYDKDGKPKRQGGEDKTSSALFGSSNLSSSFNSSASTPNPFASLSQSQAEKSGESTPKPASSNPFSSLSTPANNPFGGSTSATPGGSTASIFATGSSATKPGSDNTWKPSSPITFASTPAQGSVASAQSETGSAAPASGASLNFQTLFGAPSAGANSGSNGTQGTAGFSFGGPSQTQSTLLTPSVLTSASQSRASTPGMTSDTGAEDSNDGDIPKDEPQVDLARGGAGEEDEDMVIETRARGLKLVDGAWVSQGVGFLRILKNRTTSRSRILLRADPSGNVVLNTHLMKEIKYTVNGTSIQFLVPKAEGAPDMWALRLKAAEMPKLGTAIEENKS
ncbi:RanBP1 domain protein [Aspergillus mulundensis]|uniref:RanBD1 domain-containing protein n=1 Tax=Aspergillus mulundensis TaxID=1810919 RepID=A0A3D8QVL8_9EURO|nr:hypothetical protein DSM5745_09561 [Aspergillus mulundensis]RDW65822.1 hypothetical protein DSM5745_09561 [Aspergillus mulundensis]